MARDDRDGSLHLAFVCDAARDVLSFDPMEIENDSSLLSQMVPAKEREEIAWLISTARDAGTKVSRELLLRRPDGTPETRERQSKLSETQALLGSVISSMHDAVFVIGPPHRAVVRSANGAVARIFSYRTD